MRTNIVLDDELVSAAIELTGASSKREVVHLALQELVRRRFRKHRLDLAGQVRFADDYAYKALQELRSDRR